MLSKLLPILFLIVGLAGGVAAGLFVKPEPADEHSEHSELEKSDKKVKKDSHGSDGSTEFIKMHSQFVVPIIQRDEISGLVVLSLSIEIEPGLSEAFYAREPKLRDVFLQVLFDHANIGGFDGAFTSASALDPLRTALLEVAQKEMGDDVISVLITDLARQDT